MCTHLPFYQDVSQVPVQIVVKGNVLLGIPGMLILNEKEKKIP